MRAADTSRGLLLLSESEAVRMRKALTPRHAEALQRFTAAALAAGPWSVTDRRPTGLGGTDLWRFRAPDGGSVEVAFPYLMPYVLHPGTWKKQQISRYSPNGYVFPGLAGIGIPSPALLADYKELPRSDSPWVQLVDMLVRL